MTSYTINLPDKCPRCRKNISPLDRRGHAYAQLIDLAGIVPWGEPPHRAPIVIVAGTEIESVQVLDVVCAACFQARLGTGVKRKVR